MDSSFETPIAATEIDSAYAKATESPVLANIQPRQFPTSLLELTYGTRTMPIVENSQRDPSLRGCISRDDGGTPSLMPNALRQARFCA